MHFNITLRKKEVPEHLMEYFEPVPEFKPKDLVPVPWMVAMALQADGWWLRAAPPWLKKNPLPESVKDRPSKSHEYWLMFSKRKTYYYDTEAVKRPYHPSSPGRIDRRRQFIERTGQGTLAEKDVAALAAGDGRYHGNAGLAIGRSGDCHSPTGRQWRTTDFFFDSLDEAIRQHEVYLDHLRDIRSGRGMLLDEDGDPLAVVFPSKGWKGAHYAAYNPQMIKPLIECATSEHGVCAVCGAPWERIVRRADTGPKRGSRKHDQTRMNALAGSAYQEWRAENPDETTGWRPTCTCFAKPVKGDRVCLKCGGTGVEGDIWPTVEQIEQRLYAEQMRESPHRAEMAGHVGEEFVPPSLLEKWIAAGWLERVTVTVPAIVFDPFVGSGSTLVAARALGRRGIGLDLSPEYLRDQARPRLELDALAAWEGTGEPAVEKDMGDWEGLPLFGELEGSGE